MKKLNNKGFSLVELIIVIAIMAILVGVVGTQVIPYLEQSRQGKDMQVFSGWNTAGMSAYSMNADKADANAPVTILITDGGISVTNGGTASTDGTNGSKGANAIWNTFKELTSLGTGNFGSLVSKEGKSNVKSVKIYIPAGTAGNIVTTICTDTAGATESTVFTAIENK